LCWCARPNRPDDWRSCLSLNMRFNTLHISSIVYIDQKNCSCSNWMNQLFRKMLECDSPKQKGLCRSLRDQWCEMWELSLTIQDRVKSKGYRESKICPSVNDTFAWQKDWWFMVKLNGLPRKLD
jgi:hypothetical protein